MKILLTGGAGYIGSHVAVQLLNSGHEICILDNFSNSSHKTLGRISRITNKSFVSEKLDIRNNDKLSLVFNDFKPDLVMHLAGLKSVSESVKSPIDYYDVNVAGIISLLNAMDKSGIKKIVFSSSATVYGLPSYLPYDENHPTNPVNPYGYSKLISEIIIRDWVNTDKDKTAISLRYFNPVGADKSGEIGEQPLGRPNNLMPLISQAAAGIIEELKIFGNDYDTFDGTGIRDYIHVVDLAKAHIVAMHSFTKVDRFEVFNIGRGTPTSVLELVKEFEKISGAKLNITFEKRRDGDLAASWASNKKAKRVLGWDCEKNLKEMCSDTWHWQKTLNSFQERDF